MMMTMMTTTVMMLMMITVIHDYSFSHIIPELAPHT